MHYMDEAAAALARSIGARVRQERKVRGWTLDQLAATAAVSRRMVVNVENGEVNPSVGTLLRLSQALDVGLPALVEAPARHPVTVTPRGSGAVLWTGAHGGRGILVASAPTPDIVELWDWTLLPGERRDSEAHTEGTRELIQVHAGAMTVIVDGDPYELAAGDAVAFPGDVSHSYANAHATTARFSLTVFEPRLTPARATEAPHA